MYYLQNISKISIIIFQAIQIRSKRRQSVSRRVGLHDDNEGKRDQAERAASKQARRCSPKASSFTQADRLEADADPLPVLPLPTILRYLHYPLLRCHLVRGSRRWYRSLHRLDPGRTNSVLLFDG